MAVRKISPQLPRCDRLGPSTHAISTLCAVAAFTIVAVLAACGGETPPSGAIVGSTATQRAHHSPARSLPAREDLAYRLILIGDAGDPAPSENTLISLRGWGDAAPERTTVLFLGDNLYPAGLDTHDLARGKEILRRQVEATTAPKIFLAGNHDWGSPRSVSTVAREEAFLETFGATTDFLPKHGCPGPVARTLLPAGELTKPVTVIFLDLQWWHLDPDQRPICGAIETEAQMLAALALELEMRRDEWVIVASHRPLLTGGPHGARRHEPAGDSLASWFRRLWWLTDAWDVDALERVGSAMATAPPLAAVGGHDHSLQVIEGQAYAQFVIVSGAGANSKINAVEEIEGMHFGHAKTGFVVIDFRRSPAGDLVTLLVVETGREAPVFAMDLASPLEP